MTIRLACRQLLRTPGKTLLFLLLLALSTALLTAGAALFVQSGLALDEVNAAYATVGTIGQLPDGTRTERVTVGDTVYLLDIPEFSSVLPEDAFASLPAKLPVEDRPVVYTHGWKADGTELLAANFRGSAASLLRFRPLEPVDGTALREEAEASGEPAEISILLLEQDGKPWKQGRGIETVLQCPADTLAFAALSPDREYLAAAGQIRSPAGKASYYLFRVCLSNHAAYGGTDPEYLEETVFQLTDGFWQTEAGRALEAYRDNMSFFCANTFPTVPTASLKLLPPFYRGDAAVKYGREITEDEFESGAKVCMISEDFATNPRGVEDFNYLQAGDKITLSFFGKSQGLSAADGATEISPGRTAGPLLHNGEPVEYEIVGVYYDGSARLSQDRLGYNQVIVPAASFDFGSLPLLYGGPLLSANASFELENGGAREFQQAFQALGYENLKLEIEDMGYSSIRKGLEAVRMVSQILLPAGGVSTLCLLVFFVYLQIARRKREAAVQRSLGAGRRRCAAALLLGVLLTAVPGACLGAAAGGALSGSLSSSVYEQARASGYSRDYSDQMEGSLVLEYGFDGGADPQLVLFSGASVCTAALLLACGFTLYALRPEPLSLLSGKET